jgi:hypothetical protein
MSELGDALELLHWAAGQVTTLTATHEPRAGER